MNQELTSHMGSSSVAAAVTRTCPIILQPNFLLLFQWPLLNLIIGPFFLDGIAGTGKSFVLKQVITEFRNQGKSVSATASTGYAAVEIQGCTIHSASEIGLGMESLHELNRNVKRRDLR